MTIHTSQAALMALVDTTPAETAVYQRSQQPPNAGTTQQQSDLGQTTFTAAALDVVPLTHPTNPVESVSLPTSHRRRRAAQHLSRPLLVPARAYAASTRVRSSLFAGVERHAQVPRGHLHQVMRGPVHGPYLFGQRVN